MKTSVSEEDVSMLTVRRASWEMKIGAAQASSTEKRGFCTAKWLEKLGGAKIITRNGNKQLIYAMNNKSNGKSRFTPWTRAAAY